MATSAWVLGGLLLQLTFATIGIVGIVLLLVTLVGVRAIAPMVGDDDDDV